MKNSINKKKIIRVGSRKSELALIQTKYVIACLQKLYPHIKFEIHTMSTIGDRVLNISLPKIGEKSLFTRDLEDSLRNGGVDFVVHSLKDLPTALPTGMAIGAVLEREDARDALVLRLELSHHTIDTLPEGSIIGTSSLRRTAQIRRLYPHLKVCDIRGNLNTRLAKLDAPDSKFAGIVLAQAGLVRMGWLKRITQVLEPTELLYAVGQGALAVECRSNDDEVLGMLQQLMCLSTTCRILSERSFLKTLGGGCSAPVAVSSTLNGDANGNHETLSLDLIGAVWSLDGSTELRDKLACSLHLPVAVSATGKCPKAGRRRNGGDNNNDELEAADNGDDGEENSLEQPPPKRAREGDSNSDESNSNSAATEERSSPTVYNDDNESLYANILQSAVVPALAGNGQKEANGCPMHAGGQQNDNNGNDNNGNGNGNSNNGNNDNGDGNNDNGNGNNNNGNNMALKVNSSDGGGDADCSEGPSCSAAWRLPLAVGQEVMGQCPFDDKTRAKLLEMGLVPQPQQQGGDVTDNAALLLQKPLTAAHADPKADISKCPFVNLIEYADDAKPQPHAVPTLIENGDVLFCGLYQHACYERELYARCERLGQQLAEQLIQHGALDIMHKAQAEIHSKA